MPITLSVKTAIINIIQDADAAIATALSGVTYNSIHGFSVIPISNTRARLIIIYA